MTCTLYIVLVHLFSVPVQVQAHVHVLVHTLALCIKWISGENNEESNAFIIFVDAHANFICTCTYMYMYLYKYV